MLWAYQFECDRSLYQMESALNASGSWQWRVRDCAWYPDYLECRVEDGVRCCIYELNPPGGRAYRSTVQIDKSASANRAAVEPALRKQLQAIGARNIIEIPASEWPFD